MAGALAAGAVALGSTAAAQSPPQSLDQLFRRDLSTSFVGMYTARPEVTGQGLWQNGDRQLVINWSAWDTHKVAAAALARVAAFCAAEGGKLTKEVAPLNGFDPHEGVHACRRGDEHRFDIVVTTGERPTELGAPRKVVYFLEPVMGAASVARSEWAEQNARTEAEALSARTESAAAEARKATFRAGLAPGSDAVWQSRPVLVVEVKAPLAFIQPPGAPAAWVKIEELSAR